MIGQLPLPPEDYEAQKGWFAQYGEQIRAIENTLYHLKRRMKEEYAASGPIGTSYGSIALEPTGWSWDWLAVLEVNPLLIKDATLTAKGPASLIQRAMSLLEEDCPAAELTMTGKVDTKEASRLIALDGDASDALRKCRTRLGSMRVQP